MVKKIIFLLCLAVLSAYKGPYCFSQEEKKQYIHKGLLRAMATITPGIMLKANSATTISLHGNLEYYVADNISLRGDSYFYLQGNDLSGNDPFEFNHSLFAGASYHFKTKNRFDPYLFFEPGASYTRDNAYEICNNASAAGINVAYCKRSEQTINPLISAGLGFNMYFQKWFHIFGEARYIGGKYLSDAPTPTSLSELRFSFGLGFNLSVFKPKTTSSASK